MKQQKYISKVQDHKGARKKKKRTATMFRY